MVSPLVWFMNSSSKTESGEIFSLIKGTDMDRAEYV